MLPSKLDDLPDNVKKAILIVFNTISARDKIIFLSKLEHGNDLTYREISDLTGITFQRTQQLYDGYINTISTLINASGAMLDEITI